ncbi:hypothetical protein MMC28_009445 [Mycoblastus sanguinarius]|nr:hypothetical protein [Mycoblastus sanguinarius]
MSHDSKSDLQKEMLTWRSSSATPKPYKSRYKSSARISQPLPTTKPSQPAPIVKSPYPRLNPPLTTRSPTLAVPDRPDGLAFYKYYYRVSRAYLSFYKTGLKAIWANYQIASRLPYSIFTSSSASIHQGVYKDNLSRADFQLIRRTWKDIAKLPPFVLIFMICGEFTPLIIVFMTGAVPRIIWIPKQVQKAREKAEARRKEMSIEESGGIVVSGPARTSLIASMTEPSQTKALRHLGASLGLYPAWWDRYLPTGPPMSLVRRRVYKRLEELEVDDFAIERDGGVEKMEDGELTIACEERGLDVLGKDEQQLREELREWLRQRALPAETRPVV